VRTDTLGAIPLRALMERNPSVDSAAATDVIYGCANQAGEDITSDIACPSTYMGMYHLTSHRSDQGHSY
jgi:acetyl-CoA acetyltransferase